MIFFRTKKSTFRRSNSVINRKKRRHSLRLTSITKENKSRTTIHESMK